tara:strand:- start:697 stop:954 length:258 start_codon:yes stop_codon:yes gene_type:complete
MTKEELRELIRSVIKEYTGTGDMASTGPTSNDGNNVTSQRPFESDKKEVEFYNDSGAPYGGAEGNHYRKDPANKGSFDFNKQVKF